MDIVICDFGSHSILKVSHFADYITISGTGTDCRYCNKVRVWVTFFKFIPEQNFDRNRKDSENMYFSSFLSFYL
jgi:hypothetical protein